MKFLLLSQSAEGGCGRGAPRAHPGCFCARRPHPCLGGALGAQQNLPKRKGK